MNMRVGPLPNWDTQAARLYQDEETFKAQQAAAAAEIARSKKRQQLLQAFNDNIQKLGIPQLVTLDMIQDIDKPMPWVLIHGASKRHKFMCNQTPNSAYERPYTMWLEIECPMPGCPTKRKWQITDLTPVGLGYTLMLTFSCYGDRATPRHDELTFCALGQTGHLMGTTQKGEQTTEEAHPTDPYNR